MEIKYKIALILAIIGGLNWGFLGLGSLLGKYNWNFVDWFFFNVINIPALDIGVDIVYLAIGVSALMLICKNRA